MQISEGALVEVVTASGTTVRMRALGGPARGRDFPVVWVCTEAEYDAQGEDPDGVGIPWPLDAVRDVVTEDGKLPV